MNNIIMIVDDMKLNIDLLAGSLDDKYIIMPATSGESAIKLLDRRKPDLVLLDVSMPGIDGFAMLKFMKGREDLANIPVIFVTGECDTDAEAKGLELGAADYIKKPFNALIVQKKVQNHLEFKAYRDDLESLVEKRTAELMERTRQLDASRGAIIMGMSLMSDRHDGITGEHIERIKGYTGILAGKLAELYPELLTQDLADQVTLFSPLHDIGKIVISDAILKKTGALTPEEFEIMKSHTLEGAELLRKAEGFLADEKDGNHLNIAIEIAEHHHEKYDGTGYPHGLKGEGIPLSARIVSVADTYDALRSMRRYKAPFTHQEAMYKITVGDERTNRSHFDPKVLEAFAAAQDEIGKLFENKD